MLQHPRAIALLVIGLLAAGHAAATPVETLLATRADQPALLDDANQDGILDSADVVAPAPPPIVGTVHLTYAQNLYRQPNPSGTIAISFAPTTSTLERLPPPGRVPTGLIDTSLPAPLSPTRPLDAGTSPTIVLPSMGTAFPYYGTDGWTTGFVLHEVPADDAHFRVLIPGGADIPPMELPLEVISWVALLPEETPDTDAFPFAVTMRPGSSINWSLPNSGPPEPGCLLRIQIGDRMIWDGDREGFLLDWDTVDRLSGGAPEVRFAVRRERRRFHPVTLNDGTPGRVLVIEEGLAWTSGVAVQLAR